MARLKVAVVGLGYVGLPTALALAQSGVDVIGYDLAEARLAAIAAEEVDLLESDRARLTRFRESPQLVLTNDASALAGADALMVCVPTPLDDHLVPNLRAIAGACDDVVALARRGQTIILTSTTYVGCTRELLVEPLARRGLQAGRDVFVAFSPERIDPGVVGHDSQSTPRIVGGTTPTCTEHALRILEYTAPVVHQVSTPEAAELTKLLENTFRAVNIALANEFADVARHFDIDPLETITAAATKPYGFMPFYPGPGVGGHCIPCDPHYLLWQLKSHRIPAPVTECAMTSIAVRPRTVVGRVEQLLAQTGRSLRDARILMTGVAYKPGVADLRESPALEIIAELESAGAEVAYTDALVPQIRLGERLLENVQYPAGGDWDLVIVHTLHPQTDHSWLQYAPLILDATYKLGHLPRRHIL